VRTADEEGELTRREVLFDGFGERLGPHGELSVVVDDPDPVGAHAGDPQSLLDRGVGLGRGVGGQPARVTGGVDDAIGRPPAGGEDGHECSLARRALDGPATVFARRPESVGEAEQFLHPVEHQGLDLGAGR